MAMKAMHKQEAGIHAYLASPVDRIVLEGAHAHKSWTSITSAKEGKTEKKFNG